MTKKTKQRKYLKFNFSAMAKVLKHRARLYIYKKHIANVRAINIDFRLNHKSYWFRYILRETL